MVYIYIKNLSRISFMSKSFVENFLPLFLHDELCGGPVEGGPECRRCKVIDASELGLTASLVSQFFSQNFVENETRFSRKYQCESRESHESRKKGKLRYIVKLASLAFARLTNKRSHNSLREISVRLKILARFSQDSRVKISNDSRESRYKISVCETRESHYKICLRDSRERSLATKFLSARLVRSDSRYEIS